MKMYNLHNTLVRFGASYFRKQKYDTDIISKSKLNGVEETLCREKNREIRRECTERKQQWFDDQCAVVGQHINNKQH